MGFRLHFMDRCFLLFGNLPSTPSCQPLFHTSTNKNVSRERGMDILELIKFSTCGSVIYYLGYLLAKIATQFTVPTVAS